MEQRRFIAKLLAAEFAIVMIVFIIFKVRPGIRPMAAQLILHLASPSSR